MLRKEEQGLTADYCKLFILVLETKGRRTLRERIIVKGGFIREQIG